MESYDISLNVIDKFLDMGARGDMSNGRKDIDVFAWKGIWQSPILGHGIAQFERNTGIIYPHHFIIQMIYDGGFILTILVLTPIILSAINKIKKANHDEIICLIFLFFCSVPGALFSGDLWNSNVLWIFFGFVLSKHSIYKMKQYCCYDY